MTYQTLKCAVSERVATITLDHPTANLLSQRAVQELDQVFGQLEENKAIRCIILTGAGRFFCAGADIHELAGIITLRDGTACAQHGQRLMNRVEQGDTPVIAAINGTCVGGGLELAMACHMRLAAEGSLLGLPEIKLGLIPGFGGTQRLSRIVGLAKASEMILTGELITAERALAWGLVNRVMPAAELLPIARRMASAIGSYSWPAVQAALEAIRASVDHPMAQGLACESELFGQLCESADKKEGVQAFLEHREAKFVDE